MWLLQCLVNRSLISFKHNYEFIFITIYFSLFSTFCHQTVVHYKSCQHELIHSVYQLRFTQKETQQTERQPYLGFKVFVIKQCPNLNQPLHVKSLAVFLVSHSIHLHLQSSSEDGSAGLFVLTNTHRQESS